MSLVDEGRSMMHQFDCVLASFGAFWGHFGY